MASITHQITGKLDGESVRRRFRDSPAGRDEAKRYAKTVTNPETRYIVRATVRGRKLSKTFTRKRDADAYITTLDHDRLRGVSVDPRLAREPFGEYADRWLAQRTDLAKRTHQSYFSLLKNTILPTFGSVALSAITVADVRAWSAKQRKAHPSTGAHAYRLLAKMMGDAVVDEILAASPCKVHRAGQEPPSVHATASVAELEALTAAMPEHLRLAVLLASWCQLRRGEVLGLRRRDVNLLQGTLSVDVTRGPGMDGLEIVKEPKSKAGRRTLAIPPNVLSVLEHHLDTFTPAGPDAWVLVDLNGDPLTATELYKPWCKARAAIGRQDLRFHDLRHTGLSLFAVQGATVAELMLRAVSVASFQSAVLATRCPHPSR